MALAFDCRGQQLIGVLAEPSAPRWPADTGVVVVVGGPQYRAGSHRLFVRLARALAADGIPVLRFDVRGMGDSQGTPPGFECLDDDIAAAVAALQAACPAVRRTVLWGLCDGASASLLYVQRRQDPRVVGLCLINPWARTERTLARARVRHYYTRRLLQAEFWRKLLAGRVGWVRLRELGRHVRRASAPAGEPPPSAAYTALMARALTGWHGPLMLASSGRDLTAREFEDLIASEPAAARALRRERVRWCRYPTADHTFSDCAQAQALLADCRAWLASAAARPEPAADPPPASPLPQPPHQRHDPALPH